MLDKQKQHIPGVTVSLEELIQLRHASSKIVLNTKKKVFSQKIGGQLSGFRGRGIDFDEARAYQAGDDIRHMDWRVTARTGSAHTKIFQEERERPVYLLIDHSPSMYFATKVAFKSVIAAKIAAILAWHSVQQGDRIGGIIFGHHQLQEFKPRGRKHGVLPLLKALADSSTQQSTMKETPHALASALAHLHRVIRPGSLVFMISDFSSLNKTCEQYLGQLTANNTFYACYILDPIEMAPPPPNRYGITDDGSHMLTINTANSQFAKQYQQICDNTQETVKQVLTRNRIPIMPFSTAHDVHYSLQHGLHYWQDFHG